MWLPCFPHQPRPVSPLPRKRELLRESNPEVWEESCLCGGGGRRGGGARLEKGMKTLGTLPLNLQFLQSVPLKWISERMILAL